MTTSQTAHPTEGELLPCPFCGETDFAMGDVEDTAYFASCSSGGHAVNCPSCGTIGPSGTTAHEAITTWNTRPDVRPQGEEGLWRPISEAREDLHSHRLAWRHALELAIERADHPTDDADDRSYWRHELTVFDRVFTALSNQGKPSS